MSVDLPPCDCLDCVHPEPDYYVAPLASLAAIRARTARTSPCRSHCPRCGEPLGCSETVIDSVGYAHFVQPCRFCAALWVL